MKDDKKENLTITESSGNVFADLDFSDPEKHLVKAELVRRINNIISERKLIQKEAAEILKVDQPKISSLSCGKLDDFSIERLIYFLIRLDQDIDITVKQAANDHGHGHIRVYGVA